jgi:hypothetical protein
MSSEKASKFEKWVLSNVKKCGRIFQIVLAFSEYLNLMSGSCHLDRASNVEIGVECQIPYTRHYNQRFVYFLPTFWKSKTFFHKILSLCMVSNQERVIVARVRYLLLPSFLNTAEFYNLWHIQGIISVH